LDLFGQSVGLVFLFFLQTFEFYLQVHNRLIFHRDGLLGFKAVFTCLLVNLQLVIEVHLFLKLFVLFFFLCQDFAQQIQVCF